jgi:aldose 1-epimerase
MIGALHQKNDSLPNTSLFGIDGSGESVHEVTIHSSAGASARILTFGGIIRELNIPLRNGTVQDVVLGYETLAGYEQDQAYLGAIVGRYANRIANGQYVHDGKIINLDKNEQGKTTLHGGAKSFAKRIWRIVKREETSVTLRLYSPDGDQGFPGAVFAQCTYSFSGPTEFTIEFSATTDQVTPLNLSQHSYFNLDGTPDLSHHTLKVFASKYTPTDGDLIPTGDVSLVEGTAFDFRSGKSLKSSIDRYDCNFALDGHGGPMVERKAAFLRSTNNGLCMSVATTKPGLQFYDGHLLSVGGLGKAGANYGPNAGLCLETQLFPDSPNQPKFPNCFIKPGQLYHAITRLTFSEDS